MLLLHHRKLHRWLQPGGHAETGESVGEEIALREAREETGIATLAICPGAPRPLDVDVHAMPAHGSDPAHLHLDLRYVVIAPEDAALLRSTKETELAALVRWTRSAPWGSTAGCSAGLAKARRMLGG